MRLLRFFSLWTGVLLVLCVGLTAAQDAFTGITMNDLNVRVAPDTGAAVISKLAGNTTVIVDARNEVGDWLLVHTGDNSVRGWSARRFINLVNVNLNMLPVSTETMGGAPAAPVAAAPESAPAQEAAPPAAPVNSGGAQASVQGANLNVRETPSTRGTRLGTIKAGTTVALIGRDDAGSWIYVDSGELQGWVASRYLRLGDGVQIAALPVVNINPQSAPTDNTVLAPSNAPSDPTVAEPDSPPPASSSTNFLVMPPSVIANSKLIFQRGQGMGNDPNNFIKIGDSNMIWTEYFCPFNSGAYDLGGYGHLQGIIETFRPGNSFCNNDVTVHEGFTTSAILDAYFVLNPECQIDEIPLTCGLRLRKPSFAFIYVGVLDMNYLPAEAFDANLRNIVYYLSDHGVIPILSTFAIDDWRHDGRAKFYNNAIRRVAARAQVPLIDLQSALFSFPARGTREDGFHLSVRDANVVTFTGDENVYGRTKRELLSLELLNTLYWNVTR